MKAVTVTFFSVVLCLHTGVIARKACYFKSEFKNEKKPNESIYGSDGATMFMLEGYQDNCFIDLDSVFELIRNKTQWINESEQGNGDTTQELKECGFHCAKRIAVRFFINNSTSIRHANMFLSLSFGTCSIFLEELSLFARYANVWSIIQSSDSVIHVPSEKGNCTFSEHLRIIHSKINCESMTKFFWEYCKETFENVNILQLEACATKHVSMKAETLIKNFPNVQGLLLKYIDISTQFTFPWTHMYMDVTDMRTFITNEASTNGSVRSMGRDIRIYSSDIFDKIRLRGMISNIVINGANLCKNQSEIFRNVTRLYNVDISNNQMPEINAQLFKNHSDIKAIYLQQNQLQTLPVNIFQDQRHLLFLDLSRNKLSSIDRNLLKNQSFLQELHLENNSIQALPHNFLKEQIGSLKFLYLYSNPIKTIPVTPFYGIRIQTIDIHKSNINGESLVELANNIDMYGFRYAVNTRRDSEPIQKDEKEPSQRPVLELSFSNIRDIHLNLNVQNQTSINMLQLFETFNIKGKGNPFKCNCGLYAITLLFSIKATQELTLDWICAYPEELKGRKVASLTDKDIYCPVNGSDCPKLCVCYVRYDFSSVVIDGRNIIMEALPTLMPKYPLELWFKNTSLLELDQRDYLVNVSVLDISENKLTRIEPFTASKLRNVSVLNIANNHITSLPVQLRNVNIKRIYLDGNPFNCDCHTKWMKSWLLDRSCPVTDWNTIKCTDKTKRVKTFVTTPDSVFVCQEIKIPSIAEHVIFPTTIIGSLLFVIVVLSLTIYFQRFTVKVLLYVIFGRRICYYSKNNTRDSRYDCVVIYDKSDETLVDNKVKEHLKNLNYNVADIYSDCIIGFTFIDGIKKLIDISKVSLFCLTANSLSNDLIMTLWNIAYERSLKSNLGSIILILDKGFRNSCTEENMRLFIKNNRFIKLESLLLHESIEYLMPPQRCFNQNKKGNEYRHPRELNTEDEEEADGICLMEQNSSGVTATTTYDDFSVARERDLFIVYPDENDELHDRVRYDLISFLRHRNQTVSVLHDDFIYGEDIRVGIEPRLENVKRVILIITNEMLEDEVWQYIVSTILTKAFICNNNYLLLLTYGEINENALSENLNKFVNSHISASVSDPNIKERILAALLNDTSRAFDKDDTEHENIAIENYTEDKNLI